MMSKSSIAKSAVIVIILLFCVAAQGAVIYVSQSGSDADGLSWDRAKKTVTAAINAASTGDEVWVAKGAYVECLTLKDGIALYGGFAGVETSRAQRNWTLNRTVLDGHTGINAVEAPLGVAIAVVDGFTIMKAETGVSCFTSSVTIQNNTIIGNVEHGVKCSYCSPTIVNNVIAGNNRSGVFCFNSSPIITNNTIVGNGETLGAIYCNSSSPVAANNIVAFNASGIKNCVGGTPVLKNNCVFGNRAFNYSGFATEPTGTDGNISSDPLFASLDYGNLHIQLGSPCIDAGDDASATWTLDIDGQDRKHGDHVDIGADESSVSNVNVAPIVVRVSADGDDANDGSCWNLPKKTVQSAIDTAALAGGEVWVKSGTYQEWINLLPFVHLYGGFSGTESEKSLADWNANKSILDGQADGSVVMAQSGNAPSAIQGFTIQNGCAYYGSGVYCSYSSPTVAFNTIKTCLDPDGTSGIGMGHNESIGAVYCCSDYSRFYNNVISGNKGQGIFCYHSHLALTNNTIAVSSASGLHGGYSTPTFANNMFYARYGHDYFPGAADRNNYVWYATPASSDPKFVNPAAGDYHLTAASPLIDAGNNDDAPTTDMDGLIRPQDGNGDGTAVADIGAYEYPLDISAAKKNYSDGAPINIGGRIVTALFPAEGSVYVESPDRSSGIRMDTGNAVAEGQRLNISGNIKKDTATGEAYIAAALVTNAGIRPVPATLGLTQRDLGGADVGLQAGAWTKVWVKQPDNTRLLTWSPGTGLNNIGLLVEVYGHVVQKDPLGHYFYLDDGSALRDGTTTDAEDNIGVRVAADGSPYERGQLLIITGISSCFMDSDGRLLRLIKVKSISPLGSP